MQKNQGSEFEGLVFQEHKDLPEVETNKTINPKIIIISGPNGAGKTTFAQEFLPGEANCLTFINSDLIAAGLAPFNPDSAAFKAGRLMLEEIFANVGKLRSFSFETTLSGRSYSRHIPEWRSAGYKVKLFYLRLATPELAIVRVRNRVMMGGHDIPEYVIRRRFVRGWENFENIYKKIVDEWALYDNSGEGPIIIDEG